MASPSSWSGDPAEFPAALPKAELHLHLDGSLRPTTLFELSRAAGIPLPAADPEALAAWMVPKVGGTLEAYLERFEQTLAVLQTRESLMRVSRELVLDAAAEKVRYLEVRFCPALNTREGLKLDEVMERAWEGTRQGADEAGVTARLIVCGLRNLDPGVSVELAERAVPPRD